MLPRLRKKNDWKDLIVCPRLNGVEASTQSEVGKPVLPLFYQLTESLIEKIKKSFV